MPRCVVIGSGPPSIQYTANGGNNTPTTVHTFTSVAIGTAESSRVVLVSVGFGSTNPGITMTIAGVAATEITGCTTDVGNVRGRLFFASIPTGTTATIVITVTSSANVFYGVFAAYNLLSTTPTDTATGATLDLNIDDSGVALGYGYIPTTTSWTWTGLTEAFDAVVTFPTHTGALYTATSAQSPLVITATPVAGGSNVRLSASFR